MGVNEPWPFAVLVCLDADNSVTTDGANFDHSCSRCGRRVQISPMCMARQATAPLPIVCEYCYSAMAAKHRGPMVTATVPWQRKRPNMRRRRN